MLHYDALAEDALQVLKTLVPLEREVRDGAGRWFLAQLRPYRTVDDRIDGVVLTFVDVTELKEAEIALRESERQQRETGHTLAAERNRLEAVLANLPVAVWIADKEGRLIDKNEQADQLWAGDAPLVEGVEAYSAYTAWDPESGERLEPQAYPVARALRTGQQVAPVELKIRRFDGGEATVLVTAAPIRGDEGQLLGAVGVNLDITRRKQTEETLRQQRQELSRQAETLEAQVRERTEALEQAKRYSEKIVDTVREGLLVLRPDLTVEFANERFCEMFAVEPAESEGRLVYDLGNGQWDIPGLRRLLEEILPQEKVVGDYRVEHHFKTAGPRVLLLNARRLDQLRRIVLAIEDATGRDATATEEEE